MKTAWKTIAVITLLAVLGVLIAYSPTLASSAEQVPVQEAEVEVESELLKGFLEGGEQGYLIYFAAKADLSAAQTMSWEERGWFVMNALQEVADSSQTQVRAYLDAQNVSYQSFWIDNVIAVTSSDQATFEGLLDFNEIEIIRAERTMHVIEPEKGTPASGPEVIEPNILHVNADDVWALGYRGEGTVVANIDTGVRYTHETLEPLYRGNLGGGTYDHNYNWWDPQGGTTSPVDGHGHGSHTMGTMIGDDGGSNQIGMAPGAEWMACSGCPGGSCPSAVLLECAQFIAAPWDLTQSNPDPNMRPHVVNNSWGNCVQSYDPWYQGAVDSWHAAGVYPVFSNGNASNCGYSSPPGLNTVGNPARYGNVTGVGSTGQANGLYATHSNWGPTDNPDPVNPQPGAADLKPQVVAPGVNIRSSLNGSDSDYASWNGTSMSAPHVSGLVVLMWQAGNCLIGDYATTETLIEQTAVPIPYDDGTGGGAHVPNYATGWGEIDALAAVQLAAQSCGPNFTLDAMPATQAICAPADAVYDVMLDALQGFADPVTLSAAGHPAGTTATFADNPVTPPFTTTLTVGNTGSGTAGSYSIDIVGVAPTSTHTATVGLDLYTAAPGTTTLQQPADGATNVSFFPDFQWDAVAQAQTYDLEVASDMAFTNIVYTATVNTNSHVATQALSANATYYWRVSTDNTCGAGGTSAAFSFTVQAATMVCNGATVAFESGIPADWTVVDNTGGSALVVWTTTDDPACGQGNLTNGSGEAACADADAAGSGNPPYDTELVSNPFDLVSVGQVTLDVAANYRDLSTGSNDTFAVDVWDGSTWNNELLWDEDHEPEDISLDLTSYAGLTGVQVRFVYAGGGWDWWAQVDDVSLSCASGPSVDLTKTVGTDPATCATGSDIVVPAGTDVTYCYNILNNGTVTLTQHDLVDSELGSILNNFNFQLDPLSSVFLTQTVNITQTTVNTATWTAYNVGPTDIVSDTESAKVTAFAATSFPACADFESGSLPGFMYATVDSVSGANGRVQVTTANPFSGSYAVDMDTDCDGCGGSTTQSATMLIDLGSVTTAELNFWVREFGDENDPEDGVFISDDGGATWAQIYSFNGLPASYQNVIMDLAAAASGAGMSLVDGFQIRFQGKDNFSIPTDGYSLDDICVQVAQPDIAVSPLALTSTQYVGEVTMQSLTIDNTGSLALNWDFEEAPADCSSPADLPWASVNPITGTTPSLSSSSADVTFDSAGLMPDTVYTGTLCLNSDDPDTPLIPIPLTLNVQGRADIEVDPTAIVNSQLPDVQATFPLTISNIGDVPLTWMVVEAGSSLPHGNRPLLSGGDPGVAAETATAGTPAATAAPAANVPVWQAPEAVLYDNGPLVNSPGTGAGGADESMLQSSSLSMSTLGFGHQVAAGNRIADDFTVTGGSWTVQTITFFAYQTGSPTTSSITAVNLQIWDGPPDDPSSSVVWGDTSTNVMVSTDWSNIYRVTETSSGDTNRPIMANVVDLGGLVLPAGTYWLDWQTDGSLASGPWAPPITINGQATTGNALQFTGSWAAANDTGSGTQQGFPFIIEGAGGCTPGDLPWASVNPSSGTTPIGGSSLVDVTLDSTGYGPGTYSGALCVESNDPLEPTVQVPLTMTVQPSADYGRVEGTVQSLGYCDANPFPAGGALVEITSSMGAMVTRTADSNGFYDVWLNVNGNPYTVTVSAPAHVGQTAAGVTVTGQMTTTLDFDLRLLEPCVAVSPTGYDVNVGAGSMRVETLTIDNSGAGVLNWLIEEEPGALRQPPAGTLYQAPAAGSVVSFGEFSFSSQTGAVAAAAPAVNAPVAPNATLTLTHSATQNIVSGNSVSCNAGGLHADNSYIRRFTLSDFGITDAFDVMMVQIGIETATGAGGTQPATVNLYTWDPADPFTFANFTLIGTADTQVPDQALAIFNVPVTGTVPAGGTLVAEFFTPNGQTAGHSLFVGSNPDGQTDGTFLTAADCGITDPTDTAAIGFPDMHLVMNVVGDSGGSGTICSAPADIPWLSANPTSGAVLGDTSSVVDVTFDAGSLSTGVYTGTLCVNSDDSMMPVVPVPVTMTVAAPQAAINLAVTVSDSNTCGSSDTITVNAGDTVYYCYTVTNTGNVMLPNHTISDTVYGHIDTFLYDLFPGMSESVIYSQTVSAAVSSTATWTASHAGLGASAQASDSASVELADYMLYMPVVIKP